MADIQPHILVADDEESIRNNIEAALGLKGYRVSKAANGLEALKLFAQGGVDLLIADLKMPGMDGFELLAKVRGLSVDVPVVVITGFADVDTTARALKSGASDFIVKPFGTKEIFGSVSRLLEIRQTAEAGKQVYPYLKMRLEFAVPSGLDHINGVIGQIMGPVKNRGIVEPARTTNMNIAIYEALMNAIKHGNGGDVAKKVTVTADISAAEVRITVRDEGPGFSRNDLAAFSAKDPGSGRGLYLIGNFMDEVTFNGPGNEITMVKRKGGA